jgi:hypothetical protein
MVLEDDVVRPLGQFLERKPHMNDGVAADPDVQHAGFHRESHAVGRLLRIDHRIERNPLRVGEGRQQEERGEANELHKESDNK